MTDYPADIRARLKELQAMQPWERRPAEVLALYWPSGTKIYASFPYEQSPVHPGIVSALAAEFGDGATIELAIIPDKSAPFSEQPRTASVSDDSADFTLSDVDSSVSTLLATNGEGVRGEVFGFWPGVGLLLSLWRGLTQAPKEIAADAVKLSLSTGFRSPNLNLPRRPHATSCTFVFGGLLGSQAEIDFHAGCPYNKPLGGSVGVDDPSTGLPYTSCPRALVSDCTARLVTRNFWPAFDVRPDPVANNQTKGPNLLASATGNASRLSDPVRVCIGHRFLKSLALLAYRNESDTNHPDRGFGSGLFEVAEGPVQAVYNFFMQGVYITSQHSNFRLGDLGQSPTFFSPSVNSFSGTAHAYGRVQGNFNSDGGANLSGAIECQGLRNIRVYSDPETYVGRYTTNRAWALLECLTNARWGLGNDYSRYDLQSIIDCADWCDETVAMHDPDGNLFTGTRSTCNAELTGRATQQQIADLCTAGRIGVPFEFQGRDVFVPLGKEDTSDADIPAFTDEGADRNICYGGAKSSLTFSQTSDAELPNQWTVNFDDDSNGGVETQLIFGDQLQQLKAGRAYGDISTRVVNKSQAAFGITNFSEAARLGNFLLYLGPNDSGGIKNNLRVKFTTWYSEALFVRMYKLIKVTNAKLQNFALLRLGSAYEFFRVTKITRKGDLKVEIEAQVYPRDFYESIEDVTQPPPIFVPGGDPNPGGRPGDIPEPILPIGLLHDGDRLTGSFDVSVY